MNDILQDLSIPALSRAIRGNLYAFFRNLRHSRHIIFHESEGLIRWHSVVPHQAWKVDIYTFTLDLGLDLPIRN